LRIYQVGQKIVRKTSDLTATVQSLHYVTMKGEQRVAVTAEAAFECLRISFIDWVEPGVAARTEKDMTDFVNDLTLTPVDPGEMRDRACEPPESK
jgi:hypothetical protein